MLAFPCRGFGRPRFSDDQPHVEPTVMRARQKDNGDEHWRSHWTGLGTTKRGHASGASAALAIYCATFHRGPIAAQLTAMQAARPVEKRLRERGGSRRCVVRRPHAGRCCGRDTLRRCRAAERDRSRQCLVPMRRVGEGGDRGLEGERWQASIWSGLSTWGQSVRPEGHRVGRLSACAAPRDLRT